MLCCLPFAWLWLQPEHLADFSKSLVAVAAFSSNILFWQESGYFATAAELKPLLHTWSLAVEEQYYVLFPLFILLVWRLRKRWLLGTLVAVAVVSLGLAQWGAYNEPSATFFLLPTRAWEIAIGAFIAFYYLYQKNHADIVSEHKVLGEVLGLMGLALIGYSVFAFDKSTPFPGFYALVPTLGTGLILFFTTPQTLVGRLLGTKVMVGIGLISYSAYLWHQPLLVFARHRSLAELNVSSLLLLSVLSLVLAYLSWRYVEMPFRNKGKFRRNNIFSLALLSSAAFVIVGVAGVSNDGWPSRLPADVFAATSEAQAFIPLEKERLYKRPRVRYDRLMYLYGDSFARQLSTELAERATSRGFGFARSIYEGCPPVRGAYTAKYGLECKEFTDAVYDSLKGHRLAEYVIVAANWAGYVNSVKSSAVGNAIILHNDSKDKDNRQELLEIYSESVNDLIRTGKKIVLVYPVPDVKYNVPEHLLKMSIYSDLELRSVPPDFGSIAYRDFMEENRPIYKAFAQLNDNGNLIRVFPEDVFCNSFVKDRCVVQNSGKIFYHDNQHLSVHGVRLLLDEIFVQIENHQSAGKFPEALGPSLN